MDEFSLKDRVAIVTGSGRGIGAEIARVLADAGAAVVVTARTESEVEEVADEIRSAGGRALPHATDVRDIDNLPGLVERTVARARRDRHRRQQRRRRLRVAAVPRHPGGAARGGVPLHGGVAVPAVPARDAAHARAARCLDRQHRVDDGREVAPRSSRLRVRQGRPHPDDEVARGRRRAEDPGQRRQSRARSRRRSSRTSSTDRPSCARRWSNELASGGTGHRATSPPRCCTSRLRPRRTSRARCWT